MAFNEIFSILYLSYLQSASFVSFLAQNTGTRIAKVVCGD